MSLHSETRPLSLDRLGPQDLIETFAFLDRDPIVNVYLVALTMRDSLAQARDEFWGARRDGELVGILHLGGQSGAVLPICDDDPAMALLADQVVARLEFIPRRFQVIGRRAPVHGIVDRLERNGVKPRLRRDQWYMSLDRKVFSPSDRVPALRPARPSDYELVFHSGALLRAEELDEDPRASDPTAYGTRVEEECRDGYTFLWVDEEGLCFRASVSARTPDAAQVSGVYVPPSRRGRGLARRGMSEICSRLLLESRAACLFVNDFNASAIAVYKRIGFVDRAPWASGFYDLRQ